MKVILKKRVPNLGYEWDVVNVSDGYAQNYLLPKKLAEAALPERLAFAEKKKGERLKKMEEVVAHAKVMAEKLDKAELTFKKKAKGSKLYGSITEKDIQEALAKEYKVEVSKEMIKTDHLKEVGSHKVLLHLAEGVEVKITVKVEAEAK